MLVAVLVGLVGIHKVNLPSPSFITRNGPGPTVQAGISSLVSDRGANPAIAGGVGKTLTLTANVMLPPTTSVQFDSDNHDLVSLGGSASISKTDPNGSHVIKVPLTVNHDVTVDTPVTITAQFGGSTKQLTVTVKPFLRLLVVRPTTITPGYPLTATIYPYESPATARTVTLTSDVPGFISNGTTVTIAGSGPVVSTIPTGGIGSYTAANVIATADTINPSSAKAAVSVVPITVSSITFNPATVASGQTSAVTVKLAEPVVGPVSEQLSPSSLALIEPVKITGSQGTGPALTKEVLGSTPILVKFSSVATPKAAGFLTLLPVTATISGPTSVIEGDPADYRFTFSGSLTNSHDIRVTSSNPALVPSGDRSVNFGSTQASILVGTFLNGIAYPQTVKLTFSDALGGSVIGAASLTLTKLLSSISIDGSVKGGSNANGSVVFAEIYRGGRSITVSSNNPAAYFGTPGIQTLGIIPFWLSTVPFFINTKAVTKTANVTITVSALGYPPQRFSLVVTP